ncbi:hypothetical protein KEM52_002266, partial [Ascosphaera acerosa]
ISLRHAAFRALRLSNPAYAAAPAQVPAAWGLWTANVPTAPAIAQPSWIVRWNSGESAANGQPEPAYAAGGAAAPAPNAGAVRRTAYKPQRPPPDPCETVYIGNLFFDVTQDQLRAHCEQFGKVESVRIIYDARGLSKGFGYVQFDSVDAAQRCIDGMHMQVFEGRRAAANFAHFSNAAGSRKAAASPNEPTKTLFIGNLAYEMTDRDLNDLFRDINGVIDVRVSVDRRTGRPRGFAHADFVDVESAVAAKEVLANRVFFGRTLRLDYTYGTRATNAAAPQQQEQ